MTNPRDDLVNPNFTPPARPIRDLARAKAIEATYRAMVIKDGMRLTASSFNAGDPTPAPAEPPASRHPDQPASGFSETNVLTALQALPDAVVVFDQKGGIVFLNAEAEREFGYGPGQALGRPVSTIIPHGPDDHLVAHRSEALFGAGSHQTSLTMQGMGLHRDGAEFAIEVTIRGLPLTNGLLFIASVRKV
jgi:PAS domain S-box-containing protein